MNEYLVFFTSFDLIISIIFGFLTIFLSFILLKRFFKLKNLKDFGRVSNAAEALFLGVSIFSITFLTQSSIQPAIDTLRTFVFSQGTVTLKIITKSLLYFLGFYLISLSISIFVILITIFIYLKFTKTVDEVSEMKKNNISISILVSIMLLSIVIFIKPAVEHFVSGLVNYKLLETSKIIDG